MIYAQRLNHPFRPGEVAHMRRPGFTLIELLVVIAILGVLVGLLLPAVQRVREAANRAKCGSNLHNIGLALHNFENTNGAFPPGSVGGPYPPAGAPEGTHHGWVPFLLPYLEQGPVYDLYHWDFDVGAPENQEATIVQLKILQCPSAEPNRVQPTNQHACTDYAAVMFVDPVLADQGWIEPVGDFTGVLPKNYMTRIAEITDGTGQTLMVVEDADRPKVWHAGYLVPGQVSSCGTWGAYEGCQLRLKGSSADGTTPYGPCAINCTNEQEIYALHPGGANVLFADGSVRFLKASISIQILARLVTRAGAEVVSDSDY
jgi:prepilin-type N-terminal cleavage/methylation domain-containing protein/prepilin-type processing-associated H-X9-DG protein